MRFLRDRPSQLRHLFPRTGFVFLFDVRLGWAFCSIASSAVIHVVAVSGHFHNYFIMRFSTSALASLRTNAANTWKTLSYSSIMAVIFPVLPVTELILLWISWRVLWNGRWPCQPNWRRSLKLRPWFKRITCGGWFLTSQIIHGGVLRLPRYCRCHGPFVRPALHEYPSSLRRWQGQFPRDYLRLIRTTYSPDVSYFKSSRSLIRRSRVFESRSKCLGWCACGLRPNSWACCSSHGIRDGTGAKEVFRILYTWQDIYTASSSTLVTVGRRINDVVTWRRGGAF